jgi:hypothetical protein
MSRSTNQGIPVSDNQSSLTRNARSPATPGLFQSLYGASEFGKVAFQQDPNRKTKAVDVLHRRSEEA